VKDQKGFTLIELIVVIAIMGIIAGGMVALTFPLLKMQKKTSTKKELNEVADALKLYYLDHGCFPNATSWSDEIESYAGKSAKDLSKDGWRRPYHYFEFKPFRPKDKRVQETTVVSYGANKKREGNYKRMFPGKTRKGSDDILVSVSYAVCTPNMAEKTKEILEEAAMILYSRCESKCASLSSNCGDSQCKKCMKRQVKKYSDAWDRQLKFDKCALSSSDQCSCIIYSSGVNPKNSALSDDVKKTITWDVSTSSGGVGGSIGGSSKNKLLGPTAKVGKDKKGRFWPR